MSRWGTGGRNTGSGKTGRGAFLVASYAMKHGNPDLEKPKPTLKEWNAWCDAKKKEGLAVRRGLPAANVPGTGDCGTCPWNKNAAFKWPGKLVPDSYGKCCHPNGPCANPVPRRAIERMGGKTKGGE